MFTTLVLSAGLVAVCGCKKEEPALAAQPQKTSETAPAAAGDLANAASAAVTQATQQAAAQVNTAVTAVTQATDQSATQVKIATTAGTDLLNSATAPAAQAAAQTQPAQAQAQSVIDRAQSLVASQKYTDALNTLSQLTNIKLTPEQQSLVDSLKSQIQAALAKPGASDAASALGGVLGGKK